MRTLALLSLSLLLAGAVLAQERTPSAAGAEVYIISPKNGATVESPVTVRFGLKDMGIAPGKHTLQLVFGDYAHVPLDPPLISKKITIVISKIAASK